MEGLEKREGEGWLNFVLWVGLWLVLDLRWELLSGFWFELGLGLGLVLVIFRRELVLEMEWKGKSVGIYILSLRVGFVFEVVATKTLISISSYQSHDVRCLTILKLVGKEYSVLLVF